MKKVKAQHWKTGAIFECIDCGKEFQLQATARQEAYNHAKKTGHKVMGDITTAYHYSLEG